VSGYQFDMDSDNQYTGQLYEGQGRNIITAPGTIGMLPWRLQDPAGQGPGDAKAAIKPHKGLDGGGSGSDHRARQHDDPHHQRPGDVDHRGRRPDRARRSILSLQLG
jgi:hypothetical protein